jgi:hypothetical protein
LYNSPKEPEQKKQIEQILKILDKNADIFTYDALDEYFNLVISNINDGVITTDTLDNLNSSIKNENKDVQNSDFIKQ